MAFCDVKPWRRNEPYENYEARVQVQLWKEWNENGRDTAFRYKKTCSHCSRVYIAQMKKSRFCCKACRFEGRKAFVADPKTKKVVCKECGKTFLSNTGARFCGPWCEGTEARQAEEKVLAAERSVVFQKRWKELCLPSPDQMVSPIDMATPQELAVDGCVSIKVAAQFLSISQRTVYELLKAGKIPWVQVEGSRKIARAALRLYVKEHLRWGPSGTSRAEPEEGLEAPAPTPKRGRSRRGDQ